MGSRDKGPCLASLRNEITPSAFFRSLLGLDYLLPALLSIEDKSGKKYGDILVECVSYQLQAPEIHSARVDFILRQFLNGYSGHPRKIGDAHACGYALPSQSFAHEKFQIPAHAYTVTGTPARRYKFLLQRPKILTRQRMRRIAKVLSHRRVRAYQLAIR